MRFFSFMLPDKNKVKDRAEVLRPSSETVNEARKNLQAASDKINADPLIADVRRDAASYLQVWTKLGLVLLENYQIVLGISAGLMAMSLVAVGFHFVNNVVILDSSSAVQATSYAAFFAALTAGLLRNRYVKRKFKRLEAEKQALHDEIEAQQTKYENLLQISQNDYEALLEANKNLLAELDRRPAVDKDSKKPSFMPKIWSKE